MSDHSTHVHYEPVDLQLVAEGLHETGRWKYARPALQRVIGEMSRLRAENAALREAGEALYMLHLTGAGENGELECWAYLHDPEPEDDR